MTASNEAQIAAWKGDPWYPAVSEAHEQLNRVVPGYRIDQIKEKFGELRYYYSLPDEINTEEYRAKADCVIARAEGWCAGWEARGREEDE